MDARPSTALPPTTPPSPLSTLTTCLEETKAWMTHNFLQLNSSKTRSHTCLHPTPDQVNLHNQHNVIRAGHSLSTSFTNLGVIFDPHLWGSHQTPLQKLLPSPQKYCQTPALSLPSWCRETHPRLCLHQITAMHYSLEPLARESKGSSMCRTVLLGSWWVCKYEHITPILHSLHCLPISARIDYKIAPLTHQCVHGNAPSYLKDLLTPQISSRSLSSTNSLRRHPTGLS